jgi:hypothetical protein
MMAEAVCCAGNTTNFYDAKGNRIGSSSRWRDGSAEQMFGAK